MDFQVTDTFKKTRNKFAQLVTQEEYEFRLLENNKNGILELPSWARYRQIVSMGGSRSSKSYSILQMLLLEMMSRDNIKITCWRNLKNVCRDTIMEDFQEIIMFNETVFDDMKFNKQKGEFIYVPTGSRIIFEGADNIGKVLGSKQTISFFNEVTEFSEEVYLQITQRTSDRIICDYNPSKDFWLEKHRHRKDTCFIHSNFKNNRFCPSDIVNQLLSYEPWESGSYEIIGSEVHYNGSPISSTNQPPPHILNTEQKTSNEYMWLVYGLGIGAEKPNKVYHGWSKISVEDFDSVNYDSYFGIDFGARNPTALIEIKYNGDDAFFIKERFYSPLSDVEDSLPTILKMRCRDIVPGSSLIVGDSAKMNYIQILANAGYNIVPATKGGGSVEAGISILQKFKIYYVDSENLTREYDLYSWMVDRYGKATDIPMKDNDHLMDAFRYIVTYLVDYLGIKL